MYHHEEHIDYNFLHDDDMFFAVYGTVVVHVWCSPHVTLLYLAGLGQCLPPAVAQLYPHADPILQYGGQSPPECNHV